MYEDKDHKIYVSAERLASPYGWALYPEDMRIGQELGLKMTDECLRSLIVERIKSYFEERKIRLDVAWPDENSNSSTLDHT